MADPVNPIKEQLDVITAGADDRIFVSAMPGTGKTFTLTRRLEQLIERDQLKAGHDVLVLSFSRAAVREIRNRISALGGNSASVHTWTFDSYATYLLNKYHDAGDDGQWRDYEGYDKRIEVATSDLLSTSRPERYQECGVVERLRRYKHILIDEVQDLVGVRLAMVEELLKGVDCGFTIFGDTAQGVFNFMAGDADKPRAHHMLMDFVTSKIDKPARLLTLEQPHRFADGNAGVALRLWKALALPSSSDGQNAQEIYDSLYATYDSLPEWGEFDGGLQVPGKRTAILCRDNGDALCISQRLWSRGISHLLKHSSPTYYYPKWVGGVLFDHGGSISKTKFAERLTNRFPGTNIDASWKELANAIEESPRNNQLDVNQINRRIRAGYVPDWMQEPEDQAITVSTIHRAKGLEYHRIILYGINKEKPATESELGEESRVLFVGLTRARESVYKGSGMTERERTRQLFSDPLDKKSTKRWYSVRDRELSRVELTSEDARSDEPYAGELRASEAQEYILKSVNAGDKVHLQKAKVYDRRGFPSYEIVHDGVIVGEMGSQFIADLALILRKEEMIQFGFPTRINDLRVEEVATRASLAERLRHLRLGESGVWMNVGVGGFGKIEF